MQGLMSRGLFESNSTANHIKQVVNSVYKKIKQILIKKWQIWIQL